MSFQGSPSLAKRSFSTGDVAGYTLSPSPDMPAMRTVSSERHLDSMGLRRGDQEEAEILQVRGAQGA